MKSTLKMISKCFIHRSGSNGSSPEAAKFMLLTDSISSVAPHTDIFETDLFHSDFDIWFAKSVFQYYFLEAIWKEHLGYAVVNPKAVLEQIEATYWKEPSQIAQGQRNSHYSNVELFNRIKAARTTDDDTTLQTFLEQVSMKVSLGCKRLLKENTAELEAAVR
ncbi:unnamed protein product [Periconia digitata]|uniref:Uncharacterized protein n=1 Tax=Periconia digitata TaxID=1303443 RepID=A0A9W4UF88_9PLEO|nr:unnamed protein product [Periconia digitata]